MPESSNPLIPAWYDVLWSASGGLMLVLLAISLVSLSRAAKSLPSGHAVIWTLVMIFVPLIGPLAWLFVGRHSAKSPNAALVDTNDV
jgi:multisubunit Na+/H+ antiporter MnhG subunit